MSGGVAYMSLIGRILLGLMFLMSGIHKISDPQGTQQYMISMGMTWMTTLLYVGAIVAELAGGLSLLLGYRAKAGAWLLILFMIPTTLVFHTNFGDPNQMIHFMKNLSIIGGLLYVGMYGAGRLSMDAGLERTEAASTERRTANLKKVVNR
jgi:putative oxidoreductase